MIFQYQDIIRIKKHINSMAAGEITTDTTMTVKLKAFICKGKAFLGNFQIHDKDGCCGYKKKAEMTDMSYQL